MKNFKLLFSISLATILLSSCSTDMNINAKWKDVTIVFGLLDQNDSIHYIKINKGFLGNAVPEDMAKVRDSSEYSSGEVNATISEINIDGNIVNSYPLVETEIHNKESGIFYSPDQTVYSFVKKELNTANKYQFSAVIKKGSIYEKTVTAETNLVSGLQFSGSAVFGYLAGGITFINGTKFLDRNIEWLANKGDGGKRYQLTMNFSYEEFYTDGSPSVTKTVVIDLGTQFSNNSETFKATLKGRTFFSQLETLVPEAGIEIDRRVILPVDFKITVAGVALNTFMKVSEPSTGIVQDKREYTNISALNANPLAGNAKVTGIFSSRTSISLSQLKVDVPASNCEASKLGIILRGDTKKQLIEGTNKKLDGVYIANKKFCDPCIGSGQANSCN